MAKLGSDKRPAVVRVQTMPKGEQVVALCEKHHWKVIVGIGPDQPEDLSDIELLLRDPAREPPAPRIGRNDYCPCGSGKKFKNWCGGVAVWRTWLDMAVAPC
jgi:SWIM/SEC-C metal-binding protein